MRQDTIDKMKEYKVATAGYKKMIEKAEKLLNQDESVLYIICTGVIITNIKTKKIEKHIMVVILTPSRVIFYNKALMSEIIEYVELTDINSFDIQKNMTSGHINIHTLTKTYQIFGPTDSEIIQKTQYVFTEARRKLQEGLHNNTSTLSSADEIKKFKDLLDQGIISQEEFEAKKKQLLDL